MVFKRTIALVMLVACLMAMAVSCFGAGISKETDIWSWDATLKKWEKLTKGYFHATYTANSMAVSGGYGDTGLTVAAGGALSTNGAITSDGLGTFGSLSTGEVTIANTGATVITPADAAKTGTTLFLDSAVNTSGDALKIRTMATPLTSGKFINCVDDTTSKFSVAKAGNTLIAGTLGAGATTIASGICTAAMTFGGGYGSTGATISTAGVIQADGAIIGLKNMPAEVATNATIILANHPSGSVIVCANAAPQITLPAIAGSAGQYWTIFSKGATTFKLIALSACLLAPGTQAKTDVTWTTSTYFNLSITVISDGTNWLVTGTSLIPGASTQ